MNNNTEDNDLDDVDLGNHDKLISAISQLDNKKRYKPAIRTEPSLQISEFHIGKPRDAIFEEVTVEQLAKVLVKRSDLSQRVGGIKRRCKTLPKPLEKTDLEKAQRIVGFKKIQRQLDRWEAIVTKNRITNHAVFPLNYSSVRIEESQEFVNKLKNNPISDLEKEFHQILNKDSNENEDPLEEDNCTLSLQEIIERRREVMHLRARHWYQQAKDRRQKKIKSKQYHRVKKRAKIKEQIKAFEKLQTTDPEAALKQLKEIEENHAEERVTLRHKNTGHWAKNKLVKAKYDKETWQLLSQQLAISRDLTQKMQVDSSEEEGGDEEFVEREIKISDENNPWIRKKTPNEIEEFVSGYRKYWDKKNALEIKNKEISMDPEQKKDKEISMDVKNSEEKKNKEISMDVKNSEEKKNKEISMDVKNPEEIELNLSSDDDDCNSVGEEDTNEDDVLINKTLLDSTLNSWVVTPVNLSRRSGKTRKDKRKLETKRHLDSALGIWDVSDVCEDEMAETNGEKQIENLDSAEDSEAEIEALFTDINQKMKKAVGEKLKVLQRDFEQKHDSNLKRKRIGMRDLTLEMKKVSRRPDLDEELIEMSGRDSERYKRLNQVEHEMVNKENNDQQGEKENQADESQEKDINPNKFMKIKPKHLQSQIPDLVTGGDEQVDDDEGQEEKQKMIMEAFADDDVVGEFRKEKEDAENKNNLQTIDLSMPGWGDWGGKDIESNPPSKKKRMILKEAPVQHRKDKNKEFVIINEEEAEKIKEHQVSELPFPFTSVKDFEASIRAPLGNTWIPQSAHRKLIAPHVVTKLGKIIDPMDETVLIESTS